jgi:adenosine deaminase
LKNENAGKAEQFIQEMPKAEIHLHLEGAIPHEILLAQIRRKGSEPSIRTVEDLRAKLTYTDFPNFIDLWVWKNTFIKDERDFEDIAYAVLEGLSRQNVKYVESFYAPGDYGRLGLSAEGITECVISGKERAMRDFGIRCELIVDLIRDHGPEIGMKRLDEVTPYLGKGVIGIGIGGSEQLFPAGPYAEVYEEARRRGFRLTAHAGEVAGAESIRSALEDLGVERIGHGVRAYEDPQVVAMLKERSIPLEMCLISNSRTGVCPSIKDHPIRDYFSRGLVVTVNSDDPSMFSSTLTDEYLALSGDLGFTLDEVKQVALNAVEASFLAAAEKDELRSTFEDEWADLGPAHGGQTTNQ